MHTYFERDRIRIIRDDVLQTNEIKANSIDLIVTSPPYNVGIDYNSTDDKISYEQYKTFSKNWMVRCYEWLKEDGRFCLNIPLDKNKDGHRSVGADLTSIATRDLKFKYHTTIVWNEGNISRRTAWGSWKSASAPHIICPVELIVVLYKGEWKKTSGSQISDISKEHFLDWTNGLWTFNGEKKKRIGHPAPFPRMLPLRCIQLFSYIGDTVLDPFMGSGTTLVETYINNRDGIGIEIDPQYCEIAVQRLVKEAHLDLKNPKKPITPSGKINPHNKRFTQSDIILQHLKDYPSIEMSYTDIREWLNGEVEKGIFENIKHPEKLMRTLAKEGKITRLESGLFRY